MKCPKCDGRGAIQDPYGSQGITCPQCLGERRINMTIEEMRIDLLNTVMDITSLEKVIEGLGAFVRFNGGEDRSSFRRDSYKYQGLLLEARELKKKIEERISNHAV